MSGDRKLNKLAGGTLAAAKLQIARGSFDLPKVTCKAEYCFNRSCPNITSTQSPCNAVNFTLEWICPFNSIFAKLSLLN